MEKDDIIRQRQANFRQTNAYAMQNGLFLGLWAIMCQTFYVLGLRYPICGTLWQLTLLAIPVLATVLTLRFRKIVGADVSFPFSRGFTHAFLMLMYTAVWASVATFVYLQFFDNGFMFDALEALVQDPVMVKTMEEMGMTQEIKEATNGQTPLEMVKLLRTIGPGNWTAVIIYLYILTSPIMALIAGLVSMRRVHYKSPRA